MSENNNYRIVYYIAVIALFVLFLFILRDLPFPAHYEFWRKAGVCAASCFIGLIVYGVIMEFVKAVMKILVELAGAILLFINVVYVAFSWAFFEEIKSKFLEWAPNISEKLNLFTIVGLVLTLLVFNLLVMLVLYPLSKITDANIEPLD